MNFGFIKQILSALHVRLLIGPENKHKARIMLNRQPLPKVLTMHDTIEMIVKNNMSAARYGDGEFGFVIQYLTGIESFSKFQDYSLNLGKRLTEIITNGGKKERLLVCFPAPFLGYDCNKYIYNSRNFWNGIILKNGESIFPLIGDYLHLGDSNFTRFYMTLRDKSEDRVKEYVTDVKRIWEKRNLIIVEGEFSRLGVGNDLFNNSASVRRILCPNKNAFDSYNSILKSVVKHSKESDLILIALGMTATILAYDLSERGLQAIDIGHIDIEYEWYKKKAKNKIAIENKYTNEAEQNCSLGESDDRMYNSQIIERIK